MLKFLLFVAVLAGAFWYWGPSRKSLRRQVPPPAERMVACAHCGLLMPVSDALPQAGHYYCSSAHGQQGPSAEREHVS